MTTTTKPKAAKKNPAEAVSTDELIAKMDKLLPKWKQYNEDRKAKVPREKRRGLKEYQQSRGSTRPACEGSQAPRRARRRNRAQ